MFYIQRCAIVHILQGKISSSANWTRHLSLSEDMQTVPGQRGCACCIVAAGGAAAGAAALYSWLYIWCRGRDKSTPGTAIKPFKTVDGRVRCQRVAAEFLNRGASPTCVATSTTRRHVDRLDRQAGSRNRHSHPRADPVPPMSHRGQQ